ncbi:hypothetical protein CDAR_444251 [Caerostris darwini]|uniref:Uncharacterized protein n=1 Tax=Caerostris darwini TaxID=1538125 RepID=A0AAV4X7B3_9ARAC|nr:hypothetical protein CDAR_444251 [Caerostris darwini]
MSTSPLQTHLKNKRGPLQLTLSHVLKPIPATEDPNFLNKSNFVRKEFAALFEPSGGILSVYDTLLNCKNQAEKLQVFSTLFDQTSRLTNFYKSIKDHKQLSPLHSAFLTHFYHSTESTLIFLALHFQDRN